MRRRDAGVACVGMTRGGGADGVGLGRLGAKLG
jgi:hypothetical protein